MVQRHLETEANLRALIEGGPNTREPDFPTDGITHGQAVNLENQYRKDLAHGQTVAAFLGNVGIFIAIQINLGRPREEIHDEAVAMVQQRLGVEQA